MPHLAPPPPAPTGAALLRSAIDAAGLSERAFARRVLDADESSVRQIGRGARPLVGAVRCLVLAVRRDPELAAWLAEQGTEQATEQAAGADPTAPSGPLRQVLRAIDRDPTLARYLLSADVRA